MTDTVSSTRELESLLENQDVEVAYVPKGAD